MSNTTFYDCSIHDGCISCVEDNSCFWCSGASKCSNLLNVNGTCADEKYSLGNCVDMKEYATMIGIATLAIICILIICCKCYQREKKRKQVREYQQLNEELNEKNHISNNNNNIEPNNMNNNNNNHGGIAQTNVAVNANNSKN
eukprot:275706_1